MDHPIRALSVAEHARYAAKLACETMENQPNPHRPGDDDHARWKATYERYLLQFSAPEAEASA